MKQYKQDFIEFLIKNDALKFGEFKLKSGRISPYFINAGMFNNGESITKLASYYASAIKDNFGNNFDVLYGPAYKGIQLCVAGSMELSKIGINVGFSYNRKEIKNHGEGGLIVGTQLDEYKKIVIIDDVITAGTAVRETIEILKNNGNPKLEGIIISVNRKEKGTGEKSAIQEIEENLGIKVVSIIDFDDIHKHLYNKNINGKIYIDENMNQKMLAYKQMYGV